MMALTIQAFTTVGSISIWYMYHVAQNSTITLLCYKSIIDLPVLIFTQAYVL